MDNEILPVKTTRRKPNKKRRTKPSSKPELTKIQIKEQLMTKLKNRLKFKKTSRLSRKSRDFMIDTLQEQVNNAHGNKQKILKNQLKLLEQHEEKEYNNSFNY